MFNKYLSGNLHPAITFIAAWLVPQAAGALIAWNVNTLRAKGMLAGLDLPLFNTVVLGIVVVLTALCMLPYWRSIQPNTTYKWLGWLGLAFLGAVLAMGLFAFVERVYIFYFAV